MEIVWKIVVGGIVGWLASLVMKTDGQMGLVANVLVGIAGSALGHVLAPSIGFAPSSTLGNWLVSIGGAVLLIVILKALKVFK